jgi:hypothetical protein
MFIYLFIYLFIYTRGAHQAVSTAAAPRVNTSRRGFERCYGCTGPGGVWDNYKTIQMTACLQEAPQVKLGSGLINFEARSGDGAGLVALRLVAVLAYRDCNACTGQCCVAYLSSHGV